MKTPERLVLLLVISCLAQIGITSALLAETPQESIRVITYNIHRGGAVMLKQPLSQTAKAIRLAKADVVGIQISKRRQIGGTSQVTWLIFKYCKKPLIAFS